MTEQKAETESDRNKAELGERRHIRLPGDGAGPWVGPPDLVGVLSLDQPGRAVSSVDRSRRPETLAEQSGGQPGEQGVLHTGTQYPGLLQAGQR